MMEAPTSTPTDKDVYQLWREYLQRSEDFAAYCLWRRERANDPELEPPAFLNRKRPRDWHPFHFIFEVFGDIHGQPDPEGFKTWWSHKKGVLTHFSRERNQPLLQDLRIELPREMRICVEKFMRSQGRKPTLSEFFAAFMRHLKTAVPPKMYLKVDLTGGEAGDMIKQFNLLVVEELEKPPVDQWVRFLRRENWPDSPIRFAELRRFLAVLDLWKANKGMEEIVMLVGTEKQKKNYSDPNVKAVFSEDLARAQKIVRNVEQGVFPGNYGLFSL